MSSIHYTHLLKNCSWFNDIEIDKKDGKLLIRDTDIEPVFLSGPGNVDLVSYVEYKYGKDILIWLFTELIMNMERIFTKNIY